ncbi:MAG: hypothetical protein JRD93_01345 [Deltaproteobacteria bacterium]|nr:hypothetical protein [Deltaproteobacteria bacterium]MBW2660643.1 hypothetical protein [Deltaproteobacteria bacterium]
MIINKVEVSVKGKKHGGIVLLNIIKKEDGWTYEVGGMTGDDLPLTWRAKTPEKASSKLRDIYKDEEIWNFKIIE